MIQSKEELLFQAIINNKIDEVQALLESGVNVNAKASGYRLFGGDTPLHLCHNTEVARLLIDSGADVNALNNAGNTPLHKCHNINIAKILIDSGADVNAKDRYGWTALHYYADVGDVGIAKLLTNAGGDVNAKNIEGATPLHYWRRS